MADKELFGNRRRAQEDEYFHRQEQELIEKLRQRGREEATRRLMAEHAGVADEEILRDLTDWVPNDFHDSAQLINVKWEQKKDKN